MKNLVFYCDELNELMLLTVIDHGCFTEGSIKLQRWLLKNSVIDADWTLLGPI